MPFEDVKAAFRSEETLRLIYNPFLRYTRFCPAVQAELKLRKKKRKKKKGSKLKSDWFECNSKPTNFISDKAKKFDCDDKKCLKRSNRREPRRWPWEKTRNCSSLKRRTDRRLCRRRKRRKCIGRTMRKGHIDEVSAKAVCKVRRDFERCRRKGRKSCKRVAKEEMRKKRIYKRKFIKLVMSSQ